MIVKRLVETEIMDNIHQVDARNLYDRPEAVITVITLLPGQSLRRHVTPVDVAFYVMEGRGVVEVGTEKREVDRDTLIESPRDVVHCWYNESTAPLRVLVVKAPRPARKTTFVDN